MNEEAYIDLVLHKAEAFKRVGFWLPESNVRPRAWLENFTPEERVIAATILDNLIYYSDKMTNALLRSTFQNLIDMARHGLIAGMPNLDEAVYTRVEDENPNPSDSGNIFCRKARYVLGIPEERLVEPFDALNSAYNEGRPVIFLDDFMGSANQMIETWQRPYRKRHPHSFCDAYASRQFPAFYLVLVTTKAGLDKANYQCQGLIVCPGHVLGDEYSVRRLAEWPHIPQIPDLGNRVHRLIEKYAPNLVLKPHMLQSDYALYGFHSFGLLVAFQHGNPDASIPLIWAKGSASWTPLLIPS